jgi:hypothetical protein
MRGSQLKTDERTAVRRLTACEDIRRLRARYFRFVDAKQWNDLAGLLAPDAVFDRGWAHGYYHPITGAWSGKSEPRAEFVVGREAVIAMIRSAVEHLSTIHRGGDAEITVQTEHAASAIWAMTDELRTPAGRLILRGWGHYEESYRCVDGCWLIARTKLTRQYLEQGEQD